MKISTKTARIFGALIIPALLAGAIATAGPARAQSGNQGAIAELKDAQGQVVGKAILSPVTSGVNMQLEVKGFTGAASGDHGIHLHAVGKCESAEFKSAGGHFNPESKKHGLNSPEGHHAGDLPNLAIDDNGSGTYQAVLEGVTLGDGPNSIFDVDGSALVIHAGPDDMVTDPAGNSGARIACGELVAYTLPAVAGMPRTGAGSEWATWLGLAGASILAALGAGLVFGSRQQNT
jgi:Cu-Zn family superoxide dismutase